MSYFRRQLDVYSSRFALSPDDRRRIALRWPLFKLFFWARSGPRWLRAIAMPVFRLFGRHTVPHLLRSSWGGKIPFTLSFDEFEFATFREVLWGDEYDAPLDLSGARTLVDLGANTGMAALRFLLDAPLERMVLVEANPALIAPLRARLAGPVADGRASVEQVVVTGEPQDEPVTFTVDANPRHSSARVGVAGDAVVARATTLSELLDTHGLTDVDICKIDIEGAEHDLLASDSAGLKRCRMLFVEVHGEQTHRNTFVAGLKALGFDVLHRRAEAAAVTESLVARRPT